MSNIAILYALAILDGRREYVSIPNKIKPEVKEYLNSIGYDENGNPIEEKQGGEGYYIKPSMMYNDNHKARVEFMENQEFTTLPSGAQTLLFIP